jgi:hypothetical protein
MGGLAHWQWGLIEIRLINLKSTGRLLSRVYQTNLSPPEDLCGHWQSPWADRSPGRLVRVVVCGHLGIRLDSEALPSESAGSSLKPTPARSRSRAVSKLRRGYFFYRYKSLSSPSPPGPRPLRWLSRRPRPVTATAVTSMYSGKPGTARAARWPLPDLTRLPDIRDPRYPHP